MTHRIAAALLATLLWCAASAPVRAAAPAQTVLTLSGSPAGPAIELGRIERRRLGSGISATAMVEADANRVAHVTSRISARAVKLLAQPGERVKAGQPLVVLNSVDLGKAKTDYLKARSLENIAAQHLRREQQLYEQKIAAQKDVLEAQAAHDSAFAQLKASRETLILLIGPDEVRGLNWSGSGHPLSEFTLNSPIAGTLVRRDLTVGSLTDSNDDPMVVIDLDDVWVIANIFEHDLQGVALGESARITVEAYPGEPFNGTVRYIADTVDRQTRTIAARIEVNNPEHRLKPGMFAHAEIEASREGREVLVAPDAAIYQVGKRKIVFVAAGDNRFQVREVVLGRPDKGAVEVLSGLREGEQVVTQGGVTLKAMLLNAAASVR
ncbi:MAG TPA: efflux RND transporter periplasmic adaptor subunit [Candidatus Binataceae bacterium]|nr:efflux RND transporter periplasmic adaptor subunit [Candidatus Binataceae bacterium]